MYENKTLLITGGTGSFGNAVLRRFLDSEFKEIRILSRDEKKQDDMRKKYENDKLKFFLGDVRDINSIKYSMEGVNYVFHAAALKQVPSCEYFPMEAFKTNVLGTENIIQTAINCDVEKVVCLSTDKAVYPINAMGISKAMMEKLVISKSLQFANLNTVICITRYGNVMGSRASVIPLFFDQIKNNKPLTITDPKMTRFMMTLDDAVELVVEAFKNGKNGEIFIQKSPSVTISNLAKAIVQISSKDNYPMEIIGTRRGEKLYETILSREERVFAEESERYFKINSNLGKIKHEEYLEFGLKKVTISQDYTSHNAKLLNIDEMKKLIIKMKQVNLKSDEF